MDTESVNTIHESANTPLLPWPRRRGARISWQFSCLIERSWWNFRLRKPKLEPRCEPHEFLSSEVPRQDSKRKLGVLRQPERYFQIEKRSVQSPEASMVAHIEIVRRTLKSSNAVQSLRLKSLLRASETVEIKDFDQQSRLAVVQSGTCHDVAGGK